MLVRPACLLAVCPSACCIAALASPTPASSQRLVSAHLSSLCAKGQPRSLKHDQSQPAAPSTAAAARFCQPASTSPTPRQYRRQNNILAPPLRPSSCDLPLDRFGPVRQGHSQTRPYGIACLAYSILPTVFGLRSWLAFGRVKRAAVGSGSSGLFHVRLGTK